MKITLSHSGKQHSYQVAKAMHNLDVLDLFYTSSYIKSKWLQTYFINSGNTYFTRRFTEGLPGKKVNANWRFEFREILFSKIFGQSMRTLQAVYDRDIYFDRYMAARIIKRNSDVFWGFQGSCHDSLKAASLSGKFTVCELSTAHAPAAIKILGEEEKLHPEWADSFDNLVFPKQYYERLCEEPNRADIVVGASGFTLQTLRDFGVPESKLRLLPLGFELNHIPYQQKTLTNKNGPLKLLYAGRITQRKGIKYLLEAMKTFNRNDVELHIIGHIHGSGAGLKNYSNFVLHKPIQQYELFKKYQDFDAFVLPSVFEGFGLVILEAMAAGLPVITTPNTIGPELIDDGVNGYLVPIRDVQAIINAIQNLANKTSDERNEMSSRARETALQYSWDSYEKRLAEILLSV